MKKDGPPGPTDPALHYRHFFESAHAGAFILDAARLTIVDANLRFATLTGRAAAALKGLALDEIVNEEPVDGERLADRLTEAAADGRPATMLFRASAARTLPIAVRCAPYEVNGHNYLLCSTDETSGAVEGVPSQGAEAGRSGESPAQLAAIVDSSEHAIFGATLAGAIASWNTGAERLFGWAAPEVIGRPVSMLCPPEREAEQLRVLERVARGERVGSYEAEHTRKDGSPLALRLSVSPLLDSSGAVIGMSTIARDITAQRQAERDARESNERFEMIANTIDDVFWMADVRLGKMFYVSPAYERVWGRTRTSLYEQPASFFEAVHPDDRERVWNDLLVEEQGLPFNHEYRIIRSDGALRWIADRGYPIFDDEGRPVRYVGIAQDVTERKIAQERSEEQATLLEFASDAIYVRDGENRIIAWNRGAERIFGWTREEALGRNVLELLKPAEDRTIVEQAMRLVQSGREWQGELHPLSKDGRTLTMSVRWNPIFDRDGRLRAILNVSTDITEQRSVERQLLRAQRLESLGALAAGIAHDLNNVLAPIVMGAEGLMPKMTEPTARQIIGIIKSSAERGANIVRQILGFARGIEGQRIEVQPKHILREIEAIVRATFPKNIVPRSAIPNDLWTVIGDSTQIHQVVMNICVNARDAMPEGGSLLLSARNVRLDESYARTHLEAQPIPYVLIEVEDSGVGMPPAVRERLFDPFFTTKPPGKGTGLGLSTALAIVRGHGGFITVYSEPGKGALFQVYLPAIAVESRSRADEAVEDLPVGNGELVVVVDDEAPVREIARSILESYGYRVVTSADGTEAIVVYLREQQTVSVMLIDLIMPYLDGAATIRALRKISTRVRIIATGGLPGAEQTTPIQGLGVDAFLPKPYAAAELLRTLHEVIARRPEEGPP